MRALGRGMALATLLATASFAQPPTSVRAADIINRMLAQDPWALAGADQTSRVIVRSGDKVLRKLQFTGRSRPYAPGLSKVLLRFSQPSDFTGTGILLVQRHDGDDDRYLFTPDSKRARRIPGGQRDTTFGGMDFTFADLDMRDFREGNATLLADQRVGEADCHHLEIRTANGPSAYLELWVSKDNGLPLKIKQYDRARTLLKIWEAEEIRRVSDHWYVTRSKMSNLRENHSTEWFLDKITPDTSLPDDEFTVRELERL